MKLGLYTRLNMNTDVLQHRKNILFLISLPEYIIREVENKGVDYAPFLESIKSFPHVEVHETISEDLIQKASVYKIIVIVGHNLNGNIELTDGSLFPLQKIVSALPSTFTGYIHVAVCGSSFINAAIKERCPNAKVRTADEYTQLERNLLIYSHLLSRTDLDKDNFSLWFTRIEELMKDAQARKDPVELEQLPIATKLGTEPYEDIKTSVFMPEEVTRGEYFKLQIKMHWDVDTGTLYLEDARGNDPNTFPRKQNVAIKNISKGDELFLYLCFIDSKDLNPTKLIIVHGLERVEDYYVVKIPINDENPMLVLHVKVTNDYSGSKFFTEIKFIKEGKLLIEPFHVETGLKTDDSQNDNNTYRLVASEESRHIVRQVPRVDLPKEETEKIPNAVKQCYKVINGFIKQQIAAIMQEFYNHKYANLALIEITLYDHGLLYEPNNHKLFVKSLVAWELLFVIDENEERHIVYGISDKYKSHLEKDGDKSYRKGYNEWHNSNDKIICEKIGMKLGSSMSYQR